MLTAATSDVIREFYRTYAPSASDVGVGRAIGDLAAAAARVRGRHPGLEFRESVEVDGSASPPRGAVFLTATLGGREQRFGRGFVADLPMEPATA